MDMHKRINIDLPEETLRLVDRMSAPGDRSRFIDRAIRSYADRSGRADIKRQLREGYKTRAAQNMRMAEDWFFLEEEAWNEKNQ